MVGTFFCESDLTFRCSMSNCHTLMRLLLLLAPLLVGCKGEARASERPPQIVEVAEVEATSSARDLVLSGTIEADRSWTLSFATVGTVEQVLVAEGAEVKRGQVLARLSTGSIQDALGIAQAKARQAEDAYRRLEPMYRNKTLPEIKMVEIEAGREQARLAVSMAQKAVDNTVLRSPEPGTIARRNAEPGMNMLPGMPAFTLVQTGNMVATAPLPEKQVSLVHKGDHATVLVSSSGQSFEGQVTEVGVAADLLTRTYPVKVAIPNEDGALRVGMIAEVRLHQPNDAPAQLVPPEAVNIDAAKRTYVFVVDFEPRVHRRQVRVLGYLREGVAIGEGVTPGERVVVSGTPMLGDGMIVRVRERERPALDQPPRPASSASAGPSPPVSATPAAPEVQ
jgi:membrane fusion protein, multidrug efflux system